MLSVKEMKDLKKLEDKKKEFPKEDLTEKDLQQMEDTAIGVIDGCVLEDLQEFYTRLCHRSHKLAKENRRLIEEVRKLQKERKNEDSPAISNGKPL